MNRFNKYINGLFVLIKLRFIIGRKKYICMDIKIQTRMNHYLPEVIDLLCGKKPMLKEVLRFFDIETATIESLQEYLDSYRGFPTMSKKDPNNWVIQGIGQITTADEPFPGNSRRYTATTMVNINGFQSGLPVLMTTAGF